MFPFAAQATGNAKSEKSSGMVLLPLEEENSPPPMPGEPEAPKWHLQADHLNTQSDNTIVEATGQVVLTRGTDVLKADFARYYSETDWIFLKGNVFVRMGRDDLHAEEAEFDLRSKTGWLTNGNVFMEGQHIYFQGEEIVKHHGDRYTFQRARITTCDGDDPAWSVTADEALVELDGYAQLFHSAFQVKDTNVLFSPFMILPAKTSRQSGFLPPDYGYSTKRGVYYTQPYYWVLDESSDMTFYAGVMTRRGFMPGVEYRSHSFTDQKAWLAFSGLYDKETVDKPGDNEVYQNSGRLRTNNERFWLRGMADGFIGTTGWRYRSNIDIVSDQDYLREFRQGPMGFRRSRAALFDMFGRDLTEDDQNRISQAMVYKDWERFGVVASLRYEQNPALGHGNTPRSQDPLVQQLPRLDAFLYKSFVFPDFPLEVEAQFSTAYMYRRTGTSGMRTEFYPKISFPLDLGYASFIATAGARQTWYSNTSTSNNSPFVGSLQSGGNPRQTREVRSIPELRLQGFTEVSRVWEMDDAVTTKDPIGSSSWVALRHQMQPRVDYAYTARVDQERNPFYLSDDRLLPTNEVAFSVTNIFTRKMATVTPGEEVNGQPGDPTISYDYLDLLRWRIEGGYDFNEDRRTRFLDEYERRPVMDVLSDLEFNFTNWLSYTGKTYISPYNAQVTRQDHGVNLRWPGVAQWGVGLSTRTRDYQYRRHLRYENRNNIASSEPLRLLYNSFSWAVTPNWAVSFIDNRNLREGGSVGKAYEQSVNIAYSAQCYRFVGQYRYDQYDRSFSIMVELPGLFD